MAQIKKSGLLTWLYMSTYGVEKHKLTKSLCKYFWQMIFAIIIAPISFINHTCNLIFNRKEPGDGMHSGYGTVIHFVILMVGMMILTKNDVTPEFNYLYFMLVGAIGAVGFIIFIGVVVGIIYLIKSGYEKLKESYNDGKDTNYEEPKDNAVKSYVKGFFNKYCPKIEWVD